jgi:ribosomal protein L17
MLHLWDPETNQRRLIEHVQRLDARVRMLEERDRLRAQQKAADPLTLRARSPRAPSKRAAAIALRNQQILAQLHSGVAPRIIALAFGIRPGRVLQIDIEARARQMRTPAGPA